MLILSIPSFSKSGWISPMKTKVRHISNKRVIRLLWSKKLFIMGKSIGLGTVQLTPELQPLHQPKDKLCSHPWRKVSVSWLLILPKATDWAGTQSTKTFFFQAFLTKGSAFGTSNKTDRKMGNMCQLSKFYTTVLLFRMLHGIVFILQSFPVALTIVLSAFGTQDSDKLGQMMTKSLFFKLWPIQMKYILLTSRLSTSFCWLLALQMKMCRFGTSEILQEPCRLFQLKKMQ